MWNLPVVGKRAEMVACGVCTTPTLTQPAFRYADVLVTIPSSAGTVETSAPSSESECDVN